MRLKKYLLYAGLTLLLLGCASTEQKDSADRSYAAPKMETDWIRNGEPIEFEGQQWFPLDNIESLQDSEVYLLGKYRDVEFFVDKVDVRPYERLYTKFGRNKFRAFEKKTP